VIIAGASTVPESLKDKQTDKRDSMSNQNPGCLGAVLQVIGLMPKKQVDGAWPYGLRDDFVSPAELSFYKVLQQVIGGRAVICPKVSLKEIFFVKKSDKKQSYFNKIASKHIDYLICSPDTLKPLAGIELDDSSHKRADRIKRDHFVEEVFKVAGLPLIRFQNQRSYSLTEVADKLNFLFMSADDVSASIEVPTISKDGTPVCPKCGVPMVLRTARQGSNAGNSFYGCPNFPKCREVVTAR